MKEFGSFSFVEVPELETDLMTVKSIMVISEADIIIYDSGISESILEFSKANAKRLQMSLTSTQSEIDTMLNEIRDAVRENNNVVRISSSPSCPLKNFNWEKEGDISINIIPSLKPYLALPASNKISITRRGYNTSFLVVREKIKGAKLKNQLQILKNTPLSIVILNNFRNLPLIISTLKETNKEELPLAVIPEYLTPKENWIIGTVGSIEEKLSFQYFTKEPIIIIGEVIGTIKRVPVKEVIYSI